MIGDQRRRRSAHLDPDRVRSLDVPELVVLDVSDIVSPVVRRDVFLLEKGGRGWDSKFTSETTPTTELESMMSL